MLVSVAIYAFFRAASGTEPAVADGETRTLSFVNNHTNETGSFTYLVNGSYDADALEKLNWFMRDWRLNEQIKMDPRLFDILWEVYREGGSNEPIDVLSAYRSPQTNALLRRRSRLVAERSQHMQGKAIDAHFLDIGPARIRDVAMRMQEGGVGFYPIGSTPWVHIDSGTVRYWPRMSRSALARLFPDGKTVFIPADGQPMERYAEAKAMIEARGGDVQVANNSAGGLFGWLFGGARGGGADDDEETAGVTVLSGRGGAPVMSGGRGGAPAIVAGEPAAPVAAAPALTPTTEPASTQEPQNPPADEITTADADPASSADEAAPLPPHRPTELLASLNVDVPTPPRRPPQLAIVETSPGSQHNPDDLIGALIERRALPEPIAKGVQSPPKSALALTETGAASGGSSQSALARASALSMPLPPVRPRSDPGSVTRAERTPPSRPQRPKSPASAANPFGGLVVDAFSSPRAQAAAEEPPELR